MRDRACVRLPMPTEPELVRYLEGLDGYLDSKEFRKSYGLSGRLED